MLSEKIQKILLEVQKPGRYVGGELNSVVKNKDDVHFFGMLGGIVPTPKEICAEIQKVEVK